MNFTSIIMKKTTILILISLAILLVLGSLTGVPISTQLEESGCKTSYQKYLFPRELCQYVTVGHCATSSLNKYNAEIDITHCLCDKYLANANSDLENKILSKCGLINPNCDSAIERIKIDFCNEEGLNSLGCDEYFRKRTTPKVNFVCQNKQKVFHKIFIY